MSIGQKTDFYLRMINSFLNTKRSQSFSWFLPTVVTVIVIAIFSSNLARAAELVMMEQTACEWCEQWHSEIGSIYAKTDEAKRASLRIVNIHDPWPQDLEGIRKAHFTPTFVVVEEGVEIGRLRGYAGDEFFWFLLNEILDKLPENSQTTANTTKN